ncbi:MAG: hypothetical protein WC140_05605 [Bacteroidales bacterium]
MKKSFIFTMILSIAMISFISSCGNKPKEDSSMGSEISLPFSGPQYRTDKDFFRTVYSGQSPDLGTAKKIAMLNARQQMAGDISSVIKSVQEQFISQMTVANKQEYASKFEENTRNVIKQQLDNVIVKDEKVFKTKTGSYTFWVVLEKSKIPIQEAIESQIKKDEKLAVEFDKFQFKKTFDSEMEKLD